MAEDASKTSRPFFSRKDVRLAAALLAAALIWLCVSLFGQKGAVAVVSIKNAEESRQTEVPLDKDGVITIDAVFQVTLSVEGGSIRFINSQCKDHVCEGYGRLSHEGEWALCAPAGVMVRVIAG